MKIFLTGINGFLGGQIAACFSDWGHTISGTSHNPAQAAGGHCSDSIRPYTLGDRIDWQFEQGVDLVVHCAHDFKSSENTIRGTKALCEAASDAGVKRQIFISSYSARSDAMSDYGRVKYQLERYFLDRKKTVVRPGLIVGNGGLYAKTVRKLLRTPVVPLIDGGLDRIPLISIADMMAALRAIIEGNVQGEFNLFNQQLVTTAEMVDLIKKSAGKRYITISINVQIALYLVKVLKLLKISVPISETNLKALKINQARVHFSDLEKFVEHPVTVAEMLSQSVKGLA
jgi:NADH dehydrogenase